MSGRDLESRGMQVSSDAFAPSQQPEEERESLHEKVEMGEEEDALEGKDWAKSQLYQMVQKQKSLPRGDKAKAKAIE